MSEEKKVPVKVLIIEKNSDIRELNIKNFLSDDLYKKCNFKKQDGFEEKCEWKVKLDKNNLYVKLFAKSVGKCNYENKYDFPPPVDNSLFFGCCALVCYTKSDNKYTEVDLSISLWNKIYEKLFGGFEDLSKQIIEDENEEDELEQIPNHMKTKSGYLKDGFVVDSEDSGSVGIKEENELNSDDELDSNIDMENELVEEDYED